MNVSGKMENPILFVQRHINKCKVMHISLNKLGNIINYCSVLIVGISAIVAYQLYDEAPTKMDWITCLFMGCFLGMTLEMINRTMPTAEKKMELVYVVSDSLVNGEDRVRKEESTTMDSPDNEDITVQEKTQEELEEEQVLNQVIGEFLQ